MDDPDLFLEPIHDRATRSNWGRFSDPAARRPVRAPGEDARPGRAQKLVHEIEKVVLENAYYIPGLWWARSVVHWAKVKNYVAPPNHYSNQKLQDVWLAGGLSRGGRAACAPTSSSDSS